MGSSKLAVTMHGATVALWLKGLHDAQAILAIAKQHSLVYRLLDVNHAQEVLKADGMLIIGHWPETVHCMSCQSLN